MGRLCKIGSHFFRLFQLIRKLLNLLLNSKRPISSVSYLPFRPQLSSFYKSPHLVFLSERCCTQVVRFVSSGCPLSNGPGWDSFIFIFISICSRVRSQKMMPFGTTEWLVKLPSRRASSFIWYSFVIKSAISNCLLDSCRCITEVAGFIVLFVFAEAWRVHDIMVLKINYASHPLAK